VSLQRGEAVLGCRNKTVGKVQNFIGEKFQENFTDAITGG